MNYPGHNPPPSSLGHLTPDSLTHIIEPGGPFVLREPGLGEGRGHSGHVYGASPLCHKTDSLVVSLWPQRATGSSIHRSMCCEAARRSVIAPSWTRAVTWCEVGVGEGCADRRWAENQEPGKQELELKAAQGCLRGSWHLQGSAWSLGREGSPGRQVGGGEPGMG